MAAVLGSRNIAHRAEFWLGLAALGLVACGETRSHSAPSLARGGSSGSTASGGASVAGSGGGAPSGGDQGTVDSGLSYEPVGAPLYARAVRLTNSQYQHAVVDILRLPGTTDLTAAFGSAVAGLTDFANNERVLIVDPRAVVDFEEASEKAAALATGSAEALSRLDAGTDPVGFVRELGRRAFRRPLSEDEVERYTGMFARGEELYGAGFANGAALVIRAMLASPSFLYRTELGPAEERLSGYEIAAKLSLWLLDTTPSDELLDAAAAGELDDVEGVLSTAQAMLEQPAASAVMRDFHSQLYRLGRLNEVVKFGVEGWDEAITVEGKEASLRFFDRIFQQGLGVRDVLTSPRGFVGPRLAPFYGQTAPAELEERELGPERVGYFMQVPYLMVTGDNARPSILHRGTDLLFQVLCGRLPAEQGVIPPPPDSRPEDTNRQRVERYTESCGGLCHSEVINPLGSAFEGFDGLGVAREIDNGQRVDSSGHFQFSTGVSTFADARELMKQLAEDEQVYACYGRKIASHGLQRDVVAADLPLIRTLGEAGRLGGTKDVALALVGETAFSARAKDLP